jgi:hypothetical protein
MDGAWAGSRAGTCDANDTLLQPVAFLEWKPACNSFLTHATSLYYCYQQGIDADDTDRGAPLSAAMAA